MTCPLDVPHGDLTFVLEDEPSRSHADQIRAAEQVRISMEAMLTAIDAGASIGKARRDDPTWVIFLGNGGAVWIRDRNDGTIHISTSLDGKWTNSTCIVEGTFRKPTVARWRRAAEMFLEAVRQMADPSRGMHAAMHLRRLAIAGMMQGSGESSVTAPLPWSTAVSVRTGNADNEWFDEDDTMPTTCVASLVCADTVDGTLMRIRPMTVRVKADDVGVLETMRAIRAIKAEKETMRCSV